MDNSLINKNKDKEWRKFAQKFIIIDDTTRGEVILTYTLFLLSFVLLIATYCELCIMTIMSSDLTLQTQFRFGFSIGAMFITMVSRLYCTIFGMV